MANGSLKGGPTDFDVVIVGAGISGVNAAYRIQSELPDASYSLLEARGSMGGTWDLFKYPGIRSDSDLHTFGFPWRPWKHPKAIADGQSILEYVKESASANGIDKKIQYNTKMINANWSSDQQRWQIEVNSNGEKRFIHARFLLLSTGYYDYDTPLRVDIPGIDSFQGTIIHPQFWPEGLDYAGKNIVIIGSGATAVTLLPILAERAEKVTMLQRSPGYILNQPAVDPLGQWAHKWLPAWLAFKLVRWKYLILPFLFFKFCRAFPMAARRGLRRRTKAELPSNVPHNPHFEPNYNPWEQRLCVCPDGDFYKSLRAGKADLVTDTIDRITEKAIHTKNGTVLTPDIIITATGLKIQIGGGAKMVVDGARVDVATRFLWKSIMLQDVPNMATVIGYTNASWTLGADATALSVCRLIKTMKKKNATSATPRAKDPEKLSVVSVLNLNSTYVEKGKGEMPKAATTAPWKPRSTYFADIYEARYGDIEQGLQFLRMHTR